MIPIFKVFPALKHECLHVAFCLIACQDVKRVPDNSNLNLNVSPVLPESKQVKKAKFYTGPILEVESEILFCESLWVQDVDCVHH